MKRLILAIVIVAFVVVQGTWLFLNLRTKRPYDRLQAEVAQEASSVKPIDQGIKDLLATARAHWEEFDSGVNGPYSDGLDAVGLRPCVASLVEVFRYRMPAYSFVSPNQNKRAAVMAIVYLTVVAHSMDKSLYVSTDGHFAVMRCGPTCISVFSDEDGRLRETLYGLRPKNVEPEKKTEESGESSRSGK